MLSTIEFHPQCVTKHPTALCNSTLVCEHHSTSIPSSVSISISIPSHLLSFLSTQRYNLPLSLNPLHISSTCRFVSTAELPNDTYTTDPSSFPSSHSMYSSPCFIKSPYEPHSSNATKGPIVDGEIPEELMYIKPLENLILDNNGLTGTIPAGLVNCTNLNWISLSSNHLSGPIPSWIRWLENLAILKLGNNSFSWLLNVYWVLLLAPPPPALLRRLRPPPRSTTLLLELLLPSSQSAHGRETSRTISKPRQVPRAPPEVLIHPPPAPAPPPVLLSMKILF